MMETVLGCRIPRYIYGRSTQSLHKADQSIDSIAKLENVSLDLPGLSSASDDTDQCLNIFIGRLDDFSLLRYH